LARLQGEQSSAAAARINGVMARALGTD